MEEQKTAAAMTEEEKYKYAKKRVEELKGFYSHLISYGAVNVALVLIWFFTTGTGYPSVFLGYLAGGALGSSGMPWVYLFSSQMGAAIRSERKVREIMDKMDRDDKK